MASGQSAADAAFQLSNPLPRPVVTTEKFRLSLENRQQLSDLGNVNKKTSIVSLSR